MAEFDININEIVVPPAPVDYTGSSLYTIRENCSPGTPASFNVRLLSAPADNYKLLDSYSGDAKHYIYINSIENNFNAGSYITLKYNSSVIELSDLPIKIDIENVQDSGNIPGLSLSIQNYDDIDVAEGSIYTATQALSFQVEDVNGTKGVVKKSYFQAKFSKCSVIVYAPMTITSTNTMFIPRTTVHGTYNIVTTPSYSNNTYGVTMPAELTDYGINTDTGALVIVIQEVRDRYDNVFFNFTVSATNPFTSPGTVTKVVTLEIESTLDGNFDDNDDDDEDDNDYDELDSDGDIDHQGGPSDML